MTKDEIKVMTSALAKIEARAEIEAIPSANNWGPLIDVNVRLTQAETYLKRFSALCVKRLNEVAE